MPNLIKVLLIDDHPLFRKGVAQIITETSNFEVVGEADSGQQGLAIAEQLQPDLVLLDLNMKEMDGLETLRRFKATGLMARFVMLTVSDSEEDLMAALKLGADGYLLKDMEPEELIANLVKASVGVTILQECLTGVLQKALTEPETRVAISDAGLTQRESEILNCLADDGLNNKSIARKLAISDSTVKVHIKNILRKLNLTSRLELAVWKHQQNKTE